MKVRIEGQPLNSVLGIKSQFVGNGGDECSVEELALQYYAAEAGGSWTGQLNCLQGLLGVPISTAVHLLPTMLLCIMQKTYSVHSLMHHA